MPALALAGLAVMAVALAGGGGSAVPRTPRLVVGAPAAAPVVAAPSVAATQESAATSISVPGVDRQWLARNSLAAGIPVPAMRAYARAQLEEPPGYGLGWTTLAGIGWVESQHGTLGGRALRPDGHSTRAIPGPVLDGSGAVAAVRDGDRWSRAVGPMQFLPSTWATWGRDGDGDGVSDPDDLDDAAASAAAYLCADGHVMSGDGWAAGVLSYNHDAGYVRLVYAAAETYAERTS